MGYMLCYYLIGYILSIYLIGLKMDYLARTPKQLGQILRGYRKQKRLSQKESGDRVGLLPKTISTLESEPERSSLESFFKLLSALDLELVLRERGTGPKPTRKTEW